MENKEIEIGYYARYYGKIYKVLNFYERNRHNDLCVQLGNFKTNEFCGEDYQSLMKVKENIIDLVEFEDILKIKEGNEIFYIGFANDLAEEHADCIQKIKSGELELLQILTKEQFNEESYKVGE